MALTGWAHHFERGRALSTERGRNALLPYLAKAAFEASQLQKAREYAEAMLRRRDRGQSFHVANIVLGRIALVDGNIEEARRRLLEAGKTSGSPALDSFGPNMTLAKELLQVGESDVVLEYFELCSEFWKMGREGRLTEWSNDVKEGKIPDFGANLYY